MKISYGLEILSLWLDYHPCNLAPWKNGNQKISILVDLGMRERKQEGVIPRSGASRDLLGKSRKHWKN